MTKGLRREPTAGVSRARHDAQALHQSAETRRVVRTNVLAVLVLGFLPAAASAACPPRPITEQAAQAGVVFVGRALDGPSDPGSGILYDPARFGVLAYE